MFEGFTEAWDLTSKRRARKGMKCFLSEFTSALGRSTAHASWGGFTRVFHSEIVSWWHCQHEVPSLGDIRSKMTDAIAVTERQLQLSPPPNPPPPPRSIRLAEIEVEVRARSPAAEPLEASSAAAAVVQYEWVQGPTTYPVDEDNCPTPTSSGSWVEIAETCDPEI